MLYVIKHKNSYYIIYILKFGLMINTRKRIKHMCPPWGAEGGER